MFILFYLPSVVHERRDRWYCWSRVVPSGSAGLTKVLPAWWEAGNEVTAPHIGSAGYLGKR